MNMISLLKPLIFLSVILPLSFFCLIACQQDMPSQHEIKVKVGMVSYGHLADPKKQEALLSRLDQEDIYYELHKFRGNQGVYHKAEDTARFYGVQRKVLYGKELNPDIEESVLTIGEKQRDEHIALFEKAGVPFWIREVPGVHPAWSIKYSQYYGPQVDQIRQEMELLNLQRLRERQKKFAAGIK